jgi:hypothetical protein
LKIRWAGGTIYVPARHGKASFGVGGMAGQTRRRISKRALVMARHLRRRHGETGAALRRGPTTFVPMRRRQRLIVVSVRIVSSRSCIGVAICQLAEHAYVQLHLVTVRVRPMNVGRGDFPRDLVCDVVGLGIDMLMPSYPLHEDRRCAARRATGLAWRLIDKPTTRLLCDCQVRRPRHKISQRCQAVINVFMIPPRFCRSTLSIGLLRWRHMPY